MLHVLELFLLRNEFFPQEVTFSLQIHYLLGPVLSLQLSKLSVNVGVRQPQVLILLLNTLCVVLKDLLLLNVLLELLSDGVLILSL